MNWRAKPLVSYRVILELISATTTKSGLAVYCELDKSKYQKGIVISDEEMETIALVRDEFHADWNYTIKPRASQNKAIIS
jgi:hypothetical protein